MSPEELTDIKMSLAVLIGSSENRTVQIKEIKDTLSGHISHEEKIFDRFSSRIEGLEGRASKSEGAVTGAKWILGIIISISAFIGFKGVQ